MQDVYLDALLSSLELKPPPTGPSFFLAQLAKQGVKLNKQLFPAENFHITIRYSMPVLMEGLKIAQPEVLLQHSNQWWYLWKTVSVKINQYILLFSSILIRSTH